MFPGQTTHAPAAPHSAAPPQSPLVALLAQHAASMQHPPMAHAAGPAQAPGAPMPLNAGGHAAPKFGHAPAVMPGM